MEMPLVVTFRQMPASPAVEARIEELVAELEHYSERIISCRVTVEQDDRHKSQGNLFRVRIDLGVPGKEIVVSHEGPRNHAHEDVMVAVRDAFHAAKRQLEDHVRVKRGDVKRHGADRP